MAQTWTYVDGDWHEGNVALIGPRSHACGWDRQRVRRRPLVRGVSPDLDLHAKRVNASAIALG
jgi:branched-chain amino acid aminotransferase